MIYVSSFFPLYGSLAFLVIISYAVSLASVDIPLVSSPEAIGIQMSLLMLFLIPAFLFVCCLSHLFGRALTLSAYICVIMTGAIPVLIMEQLVDRSAFMACHILFAFTCPIYTPFGMTLVLVKGKDEGQGIHSPLIFTLYIACLFSCLPYGVGIWFTDNYINGHWVFQVFL